MAENEDKQQQASEGEKPQEPAVTMEVKDELSVTEHRVTIDGAEVAYTATTGRMVMRTEDGKAKASMFFVAYTRQGVGEDPTQRPLAFCYNGGPGSASVWVHMGVLGPRRVIAGDVDQQALPPYHVTDNEYSILDHTDLVFIDPVSTGFSRATEGEDPKQFHGLESDTESVGDFIRLYVTRYKRWRSPKFLIGESYGTTRSASLSGYLQEKHGMYLNGVLLISVVLNFGTIRFQEGHDLPHILYLPAYTATAWYHKRLAPDLQADLQKALREAEAFAEGEYATAMMLGNRLAGRARQSIVRKLARLTGLSTTYIEQTNLRIENRKFSRELLRDQRRTVGRLDSRFVGIERDATGEAITYDPSSAFLSGAYSAAFNDMVRTELNYESDLPYVVSAGLYMNWDYSKHQNRHVDVSEILRSAMTKNPALKVFVASGYYDLATPYFATEYTLSHMELDPSLTSNITVEYYEAGHMMYAHLPSLAKLRKDMVSFITNTLAR